MRLIAKLLGFILLIGAAAPAESLTAEEQFNRGLRAIERLDYDTAFKYLREAYIGADADEIPRWSNRLLQKAAACQTRGRYRDAAALWLV